MAKAREAISILEMCLPDLPTGSDTHKAVLESLTKLSKAFPATSAVPGVQKTALAGLAHRAQQDAMMQAVQRSMGPQGGPPGGGPGMAPPPSPQPAPMGAM